MRHQAACTHSCHCTGTSVQSSELLPGTLDSSPCVLPNGKLGLDWASLCTGVGEEERGPAGTVPDYFTHDSKKGTSCFYE